MIYFCKRNYWFLHDALCLKSNTDVLVGVKAELGEPAPDRPKEGRLEFFVDWYVCPLYRAAEPIYQ